MDARSGPPGPQPTSERKARDRAAILPAIGLILFMPPFAGIFQLNVKIAGVPFVLVYLFAVWAALIAAGWVLSRQLEAGGSQGAAPAPRGGAPDDPDRGGG